MSQRHTFKTSSPLRSRPGGPNIRLDLSLRSEVGAISPLVDRLMHLIRACKWVPGYEEDIEIALREALANAVIHGNHEDTGKHVYVGCHVGTDELSVMIRDEGQGFDFSEVPDPTSPDNIKSSHGRSGLTDGGLTP